ncbi:MAG: exodeoxyribonuclease VII large subunit, partial [Anaerolineae bacterium]|nr:exodeoxyribonuclease VII large subunit [Anaerolineae bacterium]
MNTTYSVVELSAYIRQSLEGDFNLQDVWVAGEISNMTRASSGHYYFILKEGTAQVKGVMWSSSARRLTYIPENGAAVMAHGRISTYEGRSEYQLITDNFRSVGVGDLYAR